MARGCASPPDPAPARRRAGTRRQHPAPAAAICDRLAAEALTLRIGPGTFVALAVLNAGEIAVTGDGEEMRLPTGPGAGEAACRHALHALFQSRVGELHRVGAVTSGAGDR